MQPCNVPRPPVYKLPHPRSVNSAERDVNIALNVRVNGMLTIRFEEVVHCREAFADIGLQRAKSTAILHSFSIHRYPTAQP